MQKLTEPTPRVQYFTVTRITLAAIIFLVGFTGFLSIYNATRDGGSLAQFDHPTHDWLAANRTPVLDTAMLTVTDLMSPIGLIVLVLVGCGIWAWRKREYWRPLLLIGAAGIAFIVTTLIKHVAGRVRPPTADMIPPFELDFSFPSGHTIVVAVCLFVLGYLTWSRRRTVRIFTRWAFITLFGVVLIAFSRLYLGYHWLTDVSASVCLALIVLAFVIVVDPLLSAKEAALGNGR